MFYKTIDFSTFSSIQIGQSTPILMIEKEDEIPKNKQIIGHSNNILISPNPPALMMLSKDFSFIKLNENILTIGCATSTGQIFSFVKKNNIKGFEFLFQLPGSLGGLIAMNAGVKEYEIFNILDSIKINNQWIKKEFIKYGNRFAILNAVVTEARFQVTQGFEQHQVEEILQFRSNQPKKPTLGSTFLNPKGEHAGQLIEAVGLKGYQYGAIQWSNIHANFLVNHGNGTFKEAMTLIALAKEKVYKRFKIHLKEEIKIL